jgi:hypothetical protein
VSSMAVHRPVPQSASRLDALAHIFFHFDPYEKLFSQIDP